MEHSIFSIIRKKLGSKNKDFALSVVDPETEIVTF